MKINQYCRLYRYTKTALGDDVDMLKADFSIGHHTCSVEVKSRDFREIISELSIAMKDAFDNARNEFVKELQNGYIG